MNKLTLKDNIWYMVLLCLCMADPAPSQSSGSVLETLWSSENSKYLSLLLPKTTQSSFKVARGINYDEYQDNINRNFETG